MADYCAICGCDSFECGGGITGVCIRADGGPYCARVTADGSACGEPAATCEQLRADLATAQQRKALIASQRDEAESEARSLRDALAAEQRAHAETRAVLDSEREGAQLALARVKEELHHEREGHEVTEQARVLACREANKAESELARVKEELVSVETRLALRRAERDRYEAELAAEKDAHAATRADFERRSVLEQAEARALREAEAKLTRVKEERLKYIGELGEAHAEREGLQEELAAERRELARVKEELERSRYKGCGSYPRAIGEIESAVGIVGNPPLNEVVEAVRRLAAARPVLEAADSFYDDYCESELPGMTVAERALWRAVDASRRARERKEQGT